MVKKPTKKRNPTAAAKEAAAEGSKRSAELNKKWSEDVVFVPSTLSGPVLQEKYGYLWGRPIEKGHGAPVVYAAGEEDLPNSDWFCSVDHEEANVRGR